MYKCDRDKATGRQKLRQVIIYTYVSASSHYLCIKHHWGESGGMSSIIPDSPGPLTDTPKHLL